MLSAKLLTTKERGKSSGYSIARKAALRGAKVTLVSGKTYIDKPEFVDVVEVKSAADMYDAVISRYKSQDIIIKTAAVADYTPAIYYDNKVKKKDGEMSIELTRTKDILAYLGEHKADNQIICGFSMETQNLIENSRKKLDKKHVDMIVANNLNHKGAGFGVDTNKVSFITKDTLKDIEIMTKDDLADLILDEIIKIKA